MAERIGFRAWSIPYARARAVILQAPYDEGSSVGPGASRAPAAILDASRELPPYDEELRSEPHRRGLALLPPLKLGGLDGRRMTEKVRGAVARLLRDRKFPLLLGGDHSASIGAFQALARERPGASVLYLDAHPDAWRSYQGSRYSHATPLRWAHELGLRVVQVGARHVHKEELPFLRAKLRGRVHWMKDIDRKGLRKVSAEVVRQLGPDVYVSADLDVFGPGEVPSTRTPEPGGLRWGDLLQLLRTVLAKRRLVGADVVELAPIKGLAAPNYLAARLAYKLLAYGVRPQR
jgi:agmatinase